MSSRGSCRLHNFQIKLCRKQSAKFGCPVRYEYIFLNLTQIRNFLFLELCLFQKSFGQISHFPCTTFQENTDFPSRFRTHLSSKYQHELPLTKCWAGAGANSVIWLDTRPHTSHAHTILGDWTTYTDSGFDKYQQFLLQRVFEGIAIKNMTSSSLKTFLPQLRTFLPMAWAWSYNRVILKLQKLSAVQIKIWIGEQLILISQGRSTFTYSKFYLFLEL